MCGEGKVKGRKVSRRFWNTTGKNRQTLRKHDLRWEINRKVKSPSEGSVSRKQVWWNPSHAVNRSRKVSTERRPLGSAVWRHRKVDGGGPPWGWGQGDTGASDYVKVYLCASISFCSAGKASSFQGHAVRTFMLCGRNLLFLVNNAHSKENNRDARSH